jgi:hypothetical protein
MPRHRARQIPEPLIQLQQQLEQWRGTQPPRSKLPESIWQSAAEAANQYGVYAVAKALQLDYAGLKRRVLDAPRRKPAQTEFLELIACPGARVEDYLVEFESSRGAKMRVQWKASVPPDWSTLLRAWCDAEK